MTYDEVIKKYDDAVEMPKFPKQRTYSNIHIFDENKSVKWNREEVIRQNQIIADDRQSLLKARYEAIQEAENEIIKYLHAKYPLIRKNKVRNIFDKIHSKFYYDYFNCTIDYVIDLCEEFLDIFSEEYDEK